MVHIRAIKTDLSVTNIGSTGSQKLEAKHGLLVKAKFPQFQVTVVHKQNQKH